MEDVIKRSGNTFGTNEAIILSQLSVAAAPTAIVIFLDVITANIPEVCVWQDKRCIMYSGTSDEVCSLRIHQWSYVDPLYTVVGAFDMLCQPAWQRCLPQLLFFVGMFLSCMCSGLLSDWVGRKIALMLLLLAEGVFMALLIVVRSYPMWLVLRFFMGLSVGYFVVCEILIIEGLKVEFRNWFLAAIWCSFSVGIMLMGVLNIIFIRYIDMVACVLVLIVVLWGLYLFGIEESLRWLLVKRKKEDAQYLLGKIAYRNKVELPSYDDIPKPSDDQFTVLDLFRLNNSRCLIILLIQLSTLSFYLLAISTTSATVYTFTGYYDQLGDMNQSVSLVINGAVNFAGVLASSFSCYYLGRRPTIITLILSVLLVLALQFAFSIDDVQNACSYTIRFVAPALVYCCSLYSLEVYTTPLRAKAVGIVLSAAAFGGILCSTKNFFNKDEETKFLMEIFEMVAVAGMVVLAFALRETKGRPLPEHIDDMPQVLGMKHWCGTGTESTPLLGNMQEQGSNSNVKEEQGSPEIRRRKRSQSF